MRRVRWVGPARLVLTAAVAGGLVALATTSPMPGADASSGITEAGAPTLAPVSSADLSCPGPELSGVPGVEDVSVPALVGAAAAPDAVIAPVRPTGSGALAVRTGRATSRAVTVRGVTTTATTAPSTPSDVLATGSMAPGVAATQEWLVSRDEVRGLATVPCAGPGSDLWLLAGGGAPGRQERLVLTNPGANEVTVDLTVLGRRGVVPSPTGATVVPAGGRVALLVDAITGAEQSPAVRVRVNGGTVRAVMSDIWLDGSVPVGAETTGPAAAPARRQVIPAALVGMAGSIRVAVPDRQQAVVSARVIGADGPVPLPGGGVTRVAGRSTGELPITGLAQGTYAVELTSDVPIVASLWSSWRAGDGPGDFLWAPSTSASEGLLGAAYPATEDPRSRVVSVVSTGGPATVAVTWRPTDEDDWTTRELDLAQDTATSFDLGPVDSVWVRRTSGAGEVRAAVASVGGQPGGRMVSSAPLVESAVTSAVSRAHPVP